MSCLEDTGIISEGNGSETNYKYESDGRTKKDDNWQEITEQVSQLRQIESSEKQEKHVREQNFISATEEIDSKSKDAQTMRKEMFNLQEESAQMSSVSESGSKNKDDIAQQLSVQFSPVKETKDAKKQHNKAQPTRIQASSESVSEDVVKQENRIVSDADNFLESDILDEVTSQNVGQKSSTGKLNFTGNLMVNKIEQISVKCSSLNLCEHSRRLDNGPQQDRIENSSGRESQHADIPDGGGGDDDDDDNDDVHNSTQNSSLCKSKRLNVEDDLESINTAQSVSGSNTLNGEKQRQDDNSDQNSPQKVPVNSKKISISCDTVTVDSSIDVDDINTSPEEIANEDKESVCSNNITEKIDALKACVVDLSASIVDINGNNVKGTPSESKILKKEKNHGSLKPHKKSPKENEKSPRRSDRNKNKHKQLKVEDDLEIEEIEVQDPLLTLPSREKAKPKSHTSKNNTIIVKDTKRLAELASRSKEVSGGKKEPTLIIIDTQSILAGKGPVPLAQAYTTPTSATSTPGYSVIPISLPSKGVLLPLRVNSAQNSANPSESVSLQNVSPPSQLVTPSTSQILSSTLEELYVIESPSFVVPYLYLKSASESFKEYIEKLKIEMQKIEDSKNSIYEGSHQDTGYDVSISLVDEKSAHKKESTENKVSDDGCKEISKKSNICDLKEVTNEEKGKPLKEDTDLINNEKEKNEGKRENEQENKLTKIIEVAKKDTIEIKRCSDKKNYEESEKSSEDTKKAKVNTSPPEKKDKNSLKLEEATKYFDSPIGKFFLQIGLNLVEEYVQTDALRLYKRKRDREGAQSSASTDALINKLVKILEASKEITEPFHSGQKKCEYCSFKTESSLVMAQHLETPHMRNYIYRCNFCPLQIRSPHDILYHMESEHRVRGRLERAPATHQCPNCTFEDSQKSKLTRHLLVCFKKFKQEKNLEPPSDWAPPAKIIRSTPKRPILGLGALTKPKKSVHSLLPKLAPAPARTKLEECLTRGRGRPSIPSPFYPQENKVPRSIAPNPFSRPGTISSQSQILLPVGYQITSSAVCHTSATTTASKLLSKNPHVSITPLPKGPQPSSSRMDGHLKAPERGGRSTSSMPSFVVCEVCDGYIKDLEQLRNHMQWIHKVKIHPKMIHNRPPLNCQKCQSRFFTDQGLERHLLGTHGLVTSSMQEAANKGRDAGRCPICGRVYNCKLLSHVNHDHNLSLRPAHLSYKCTVCTATFEMYKDFEHHVYSVHSSVAKRSAAEKQEGMCARRLVSNETLLKPLKINDEVTVIPHSGRGSSHALATCSSPASRAHKRRPRKRPMPRRLTASRDKDVQVIDLGDSSEDNASDDDDKGDEQITLVTTSKSPKGGKLGASNKAMHDEETFENSKLMSDDDDKSENDEGLEILKQLCKDVSDEKSDNDDDDVTIETIKSLSKFHKRENQIKEKGNSLLLEKVSENISGKSFGADSEGFLRTYSKKRKIAYEEDLDNESEEGDEDAKKECFKKRKRSRKDSESSQDSIKSLDDITSI